VDRVIAPYQARLDSAQAEQDTTARNLSEGDQLAIALVSLANQERVLIIEIVREGMVSPGVAQALLSNTEALAEAARSEGRMGYESASNDTLGHRIGFHVALFLYRRLGVVRMLADRRETRNSVRNAHRSRTPHYV
jgi:Na+:H+ antiporter